MEIKKKSKHYKSVFENEQDLLKALMDIHLNGEKIELDPLFFKGNFYKDGIEKPDYYYDINPELCGGIGNPECADATNLHWLKDATFNNMILDPPFMFGGHGKQCEYYSSKTHGFITFDELIDLYRGILKEACRLLKVGGILIFKCQDYTDSKTTMTHCLVYNWAIEQGFYAKDIAILVKPNKIYNSNTTQRHLRKIHTYFWVFERRRK